MTSRFPKLARSNGQPKKEEHKFALESDAGGFAPVGFDMTAELVARLSQWKPYFELIQPVVLNVGKGGTDVEPLADRGASVISFMPVSAHYFDYHHSALDQLNIVNPAEVQAGASVMTAFIYLASEKGDQP